MYSKGELLGELEKMNTITLKYISQSHVDAGLIESVCCILYSVCMCNHLVPFIWWFSSIFIDKKALCVEYEP